MIGMIKEREVSCMSKETDKFLSLYRTYENLLRDHGTDYRAVEEAQTGGRMTMMRQMRNYLSHSEDPGFIAISPLCMKVLEDMVKDEALKGDIVKNHLVTPAKGSIKAGTMLSAAVYRLARLSAAGVQSLPVYDESTKRLLGVLTLERAAFDLDAAGNCPLGGATVESGAGMIRLVKPTDPVPEGQEGGFWCCTKDGTMDSQYMGYVDRPDAGKAG